MGLKYTIMDKIGELFYEYPDHAFTVREIATRTGIPKSSVQKYLQELRKQQFIDSENRAISSLLFKTKKINHFVEKIVSSGLLEYLLTVLTPSCIVLFGSIRKGDSVKESDIDLFIESHLKTGKKDFNLTKWEKKLGHPTQLFIEQDIQDLPPPLFNNVVNGIKLYGSMKIKK